MITSINIPVQRFEDINGRPLVGGRLYTYAAGTSEPATTYMDDVGTENTNPIVLNERGECKLYVDSSVSYKFVLKDDHDVVIWEVDNVVSGGEGGGGSGVDVDVVGTENEITVRRVAINRLERFVVGLSASVKNTINYLIGSIASALDSLSSKADKVQGATAGNFAGLDSSGNLTDSGSKAADFKTKQTPVTDPSASGAGLEFIDSVTQDANGVITPHKKTVQDGTTAQKGVVQLQDSIGSTESATDKAVTPHAVRAAINSAVSSAYHAAGTKTVAQLTSSLLVAENEGCVYNVTDSGTTTSDFVDGAGHPINAGDNVGVCDVGGGVYKFDLLSGFVDLSNYLTKTGDASNTTATFTKASGDTSTIASGSNLSAIITAISSFFASLKALAFKDKVSDSDINGTISDSHIASASTWNGKQDSLGINSSSGDADKYLNQKGSFTMPTFIHTPRIDNTTDANTLTSSRTSRIVEEEATSTNNLPDNSSWWHLLSIQGNDNKYATQLALGMTTESIQYRCKVNNVWSSWNNLRNASWITSGTFGTDRIADDAITASKVKDNETLPVNISGTAKHLDCYGLWHTYGTGYYNAATPYAIIGELNLNIAGNTGAGQLLQFELDSGMYARIRLDIKWSNGSLQRANALIIDSSVDYSTLQDWIKITHFTFTSGGNSFLCIRLHVKFTGDWQVWRVRQLDCQTGDCGFTNWADFPLRTGTRSQEASAYGTLVTYKFSQPCADGQKGSPTTPVYVDPNGQVQPCTPSGGAKKSNTAELYIAGYVENIPYYNVRNIKNGCVNHVDFSNITNSTCNITFEAPTLSTGEEYDYIISLEGYTNNSGYSTGAVVENCKQVLRYDYVNNLWIGEPLFLQATDWRQICVVRGNTCEWKRVTLS